MKNMRKPNPKPNPKLNPNLNPKNAGTHPSTLFWMLTLQPGTQLT